MRWLACSLPTYLTPKSSTTRLKETERQSCVQKPGVSLLCLYPFAFNLLLTSLLPVFLIAVIHTFLYEFRHRHIHPLWGSFPSNGTSSTLGGQGDTPALCLHGSCGTRVGFNFCCSICCLQMFFSFCGFLENIFKALEGLYRGFGHNWVHVSLQGFYHFPCSHKDSI